jgi:sugar phosphate isomerase/epimerase
MKIGLGGTAHLSYCTNIHPGESWEETLANLRGPLLEVRRAVAPHIPFGIGLRLSGRAAASLEAPAAFAELLELLESERMYVFTINGFPHGTFHRGHVKELVYRPDWLEESRIAYSDRLARLLAALLPDGVEGSVSTVPGAFFARVSEDGAQERIAESLRRHVLTLHRIRERTGKRISIALEPEPACLLETSRDAIEFFERHLLSRDAVARFSSASGLSPSNAESVLRDHAGLCLDACHMAVEGEDPTSALVAVKAAGIQVSKVQISTGLSFRFAPSDRERVQAIASFADGVYLHQVVERREGGVRRWVDLPDALSAIAHEPREDQDLEREWRVHFHVPIFRDRLGPFSNTQSELRALIAALKKEGLAPHLEVETYCWEVLPEEHKREGLVAAVARELTWARSELAP